MLNPANLFTVMLANDSEGKLFIYDAVRYKGAIWLVPGWLENSLEEWKKPKRLIRVDQLEVMPKDYPADYLLRDPVPKALLDLDTEIPTASGCEVIDQPQIRISTRKPTVN